MSEESATAVAGRSGPDRARPAVLGDARVVGRVVGLLLVLAGATVALVYSGAALRELDALAALFTPQRPAVASGVAPRLIGLNLAGAVLVVGGLLVIRRNTLASATVEVRDIRDGEHEELAAVTVDAYEVVLGERLGAGYASVLRDVASRAAQATVLVAVEGDRVVGGVTYVGGPGPWAEFSETDAAGIRMLAVAPAAQRRGVGARLLQACLDRARADGKARIVLHTTPWMVEAHRLYRRFGFARTPERDLRADGLDLPAYVLDLGACP